MKTIFYEFLYSDCVMESAYETMSLHKTKAGAYKAMRKFIVDEYNKWYDDRILNGISKRFNNKFAPFCAWCISSIELED